MSSSVFYVIMCFFKWSDILSELSDGWSDIYEIWLENVWCFRDILCSLEFVLLEYFLKKKLKASDSIFFCKCRMYMCSMFTLFCLLLFLVGKRYIWRIVCTTSSECQSICQVVNVCVLCCWYSLKQTCLNHLCMI